MVSGTRCPYVSVCGYEVVSGAAAPNGPMTYADFFRASRLGIEPQGWDLSLEAWIRAWRLGFELHGWDLSFNAGILALRLGFGP